MGNPIFADPGNRSTSKRSLDGAFPVEETMGRFPASMRTTRRQIIDERMARLNIHARISRLPYPDRDLHPIRFVLAEEAAIAEEERAVRDQAPDPVDVLEALIGNQLRPRNYSLLHGTSVVDINPRTRQDTDHHLQSMETMMTRLRRQLRSSTDRMTQDMHMMHRSQTQPREMEPRVRLVNERIMRRVRAARRAEGTIDSAVLRWSASQSEADQSLRVSQNRTGSRPSESQAQL